MAILFEVAQEKNGRGQNVYLWVVYGTVDVVGCSIRSLVDLDLYLTKTMGQEM